MRRLIKFAIVGLLGSLLPAVAEAQSPGHVPLAQLLPQLVVDAAVIAPGSQGNQANHFVPSAGANPALAGLNRTLALEVGGFPLGPTGTTVVSGGDSGADGKAKFAPGYTDGAATLGRGRRIL